MGKGCISPGLKSNEDRETVVDVFQDRCLPRSWGSSWKAYSFQLSYNICMATQGTGCYGDEKEPKEEETEKVSQQK